MSSKNFSIDVKQWALAAGVEQIIFIPGTFFQVMDATGVLDIEVVREHSAIGKAAQVPAGFSFGGPDGELFHAVKVTSATTQTVSLCFARGNVDLKRMVGSVEVTNVNGAHTNSRATVLSTVASTLSAANALRRMVSIQNNDTAVALRVTTDGTTPTTTTGFRILPNDTWEPAFAPTGAIQAIAESGAGVAVEVVTA